MGRIKATRHRRERFRIDDKPVDEAQLLAEAARMAETVEDNGRVTYLDKIFGPNQVPAEIDPDGSLQDAADQDAPIPVALFEPARAMVAQLPGQAPTEAQVEGAVMLGLHRVTTGAVVFRQSPGWSLHRLDGDRLELRSPDGGVYSRITPADPGDWIAAAESLGYALCLYGPQLGVRVPPNLKQGQYTDAARIEEIRTARGRGLVAGGFVTFHPNR